MTDISEKLLSIQWAQFKNKLQWILWHVSICLDFFYSPIRDSSWTSFCSIAARDVLLANLGPYQKALTKRSSLFSQKSSILNVSQRFEYAFWFISIKFASLRTSKAFLPFPCVTKR